MGSARPKSDVLQVGSNFGRYRIERVVGRGGMGAVYEATHLELNKRVAVKILLPSVAENPEVRARFLREGQSVAKIRHPNVADVYDVGTHDNISYLVMEFLDGEDLGVLLKRERSIPAVRAADIMIPVLAAISVAHEENIIHRDLKPANIFLAQGRRGELQPKVVDFGISKIINEDVSEGLTSTGAVIGTPFYMSPEQANGDKMIDARTDLYSLGVILYQMVTGKRPFQADSMYQILHKIVLGTFDPPRALSPSIPEQLERIILKAMARTPGERFANAHEMGAALLPLASPRVRSHWEPTFAGAEEVALPLRTHTMPPAIASAALHEPIAPNSFTVGSSEQGARTTVLPPPRKSQALWIVLGVASLIFAGAIVYVVSAGDPSVQVIEVVEPPPVRLVAPAEKAPSEPVVAQEPAVEPAVEAAPLPEEKKETKKASAKVRPKKDEPKPKKGANDALILR